jgi:hypothetical protein
MGPPASMVGSLPAGNGTLGGVTSQLAGKTKLTASAELGGALKQVQQAFSAFQVARNQFVNSLSVRRAGPAGACLPYCTIGKPRESWLRANAAQVFLDKQDEHNVTLEALMKNDVMAVLCCPLAQDSVPGEGHGTLRAIDVTCIQEGSEKG